MERVLRLIESLITDNSVLCIEVAGLLTGAIALVASVEITLHGWDDSWFNPSRYRRGQPVDRRIKKPR